LNWLFILIYLGVTGSRETPHSFFFLFLFFIFSSKPQRKQGSKQPVFFVNNVVSLALHLMTSKRTFEMIRRLSSSNSDSIILDSIIQEDPRRLAGDSVDDHVRSAAEKRGTFSKPFSKVLHIASFPKDSLCNLRFNLGINGTASSSDAAEALNIPDVLSFSDPKFMDPCINQLANEDTLTLR